MKRIGADSTDVLSSLCLKHTCVDEAFLSCCKALQEHGRCQWESWGQKTCVREWVCVSVILGLWAADLSGLPLSLSLSPALSYVNLHKPFKATWTTKRKLRIDQNTHTHTHGISFSPFLMCLSRQTAALTAVLQSWNFCDMLVRVFLLLGNVWLSFVPAGWII